MSTGDSTSDAGLPPVRVPPVLRPSSPTAQTNVESPGMISSGADRGRRRTVYLLAAGALCLAGLSAIPAALQIHASHWPIWAELVTCMCVLQAAYAVWLLTVIDWGAVRVLMVVQALVATLYGVGMMLAVATPVEQVSFFDLDEVRGAARWWCPLIMCLAGTLSYLCGRIGHRWRRDNAARY